MAITFSGLATGLDTASLIDAIMEVERTPVTTMENTKTYLETKLETFTEFNSLLERLYTAVTGLNSRNDCKAYTVTNSGSEYFSLATTSLSSAGSYAVKVVSLAQQQKDVSTSTVADTTTATLSGTLLLGDQTLTYENISLGDLVDQINGGGYGLVASMIDDGTGSGYRLLLSAEQAGTTIEIFGTGSIEMDTATNGHTLAGTKAHVNVDGIDYYGTSNTMTNAIKGATLTLLAAGGDTAKHVSVASDAENIISTKLEEMVTAFNDIATLITTIRTSDPTLANTMQAVQRTLRNALTTAGFIALGVTSDWQSGKLSFSASTLSTAFADDAEGVLTTLFGNDTSSGTMKRLDDYLTEQLNNTTGFFVTKKTLVNKKISDLDNRIESMETRLEKRRATLEAQYAAMETLVSSLNSQSDYLTSFFNSYNKSS